MEHWYYWTVGDVELAHRVMFAPVTRYHVDDAHMPLPHVAEYYEQHWESPHLRDNSHHPNTPGIWSNDQIAAWKAVTDSVHAKGSFMLLQIWALGRAVQAEVLEKENIACISPSDIPLPGGPTPRPLTIDEIRDYMELYAQAAKNAINKAGFDGVEIHGANGYLIDQSVENRVRFALEVTEAVVKAVGQKKTAFRITPWGTWQDMQIDDPKPTYGHLITELHKRYPDLAYLHAVEPRTDGDGTSTTMKEHHLNDFLREIWGDRPFISARGYTRASGIAAEEEKGDLIAYACPYISNPDLPYHLIHDIALTVGDRALYYAPGSVDPKGYTDYAFASPIVKAQA
ncbi:NADH:flavin oxidoreductase/NADH oxidase [Mycena leptocephala]|nr:NADH:flavin oxidoreductase/NADH oxidase [Mycena leptocephala]